MQNFALIGAGGFVAPRHLVAIRDTQNVIVAATDPNDSVGILDSYSFNIRFFREIERFDRYLEKLRRGPEAGRVHYVSICSPNYLHDAHIRLALRIGGGCDLREAARHQSLESRCARCAAGRDRPPHSHNPAVAIASCIGRIAGTPGR